MLQGAVKAHERKVAHPKPSSFNLGSSPPDQPPRSSITQLTNPGYKNPLGPTTASALNQEKGVLHASRSGAGVKRTSSGIAKALGGTFDNGFGSQQQPILINGRSPGKHAAPLVDLFDENEFDSDVDLDVEQPLPKSTVSYPKLPAQPPINAISQPPVYPTLRKEQPKPTSTRQFSTAANPRHGVVETPAAQQAPDSSAPIPWSSSPMDHHSSVIGRPSLQQFAYNAANVGKRTIEHESTSPRPAKRRVLPWLDEEAKEDATSTSGATKSQAGKSSAFTPLPRDSKKSQYPWNTTASAIKDQQKRHREEVRKAAKKIDATEDSVLKAKSTQKRPARVFLSEEQQHVLDLVIDQKKSAFFTGSAGTGKSVLMREIISNLRKKYQKEPDRVAVTASTGLAACNVGGVTLHSFAGIGLGKEEVPELVRKIKKNAKAKHRWMRTKVLVVDEISMVDGDLFDKLEAVARQIRNNARPFGGIQLVITGDFFQLPPVPDNSRVAKFAFDAATWKTSIEHTIGLHHVFRQKDPIFAGMLNEMREGRLSASSIKTFKSLERNLNFEDMLEATELFPTRGEVDKANTTRLTMLQGDSFHFPARDGGSMADKMHRDKLLQNCLAPEAMTLKKGAQVMLIKNIDETLVNGSLGRVIGFFSSQQFDMYNQHDSSAFPQSPGGTIQSGDTTFGPEHSKALMSGGFTTSPAYPLVRFAIADGTWRDLLCEPESWKVELPNGEVQASRSQVPLILAWALSIHKAQGQTLERVKVDLGKVFEKGQAYVALSRATSMAGLQIKNFDPRKVNAHDKVRTFYAALGRVELAEKNKERMEKIRKPGPTTAEEYEGRFVVGGNMSWDDLNA